MLFSSLPLCVLAFRIKAAKNSRGVFGKTLKEQTEGKLGEWKQKKGKLKYDNFRKKNVFSQLILSSINSIIIEFYQNAGFNKITFKLSVEKKQGIILTNTN